MSDSKPFQLSQVREKVIQHLETLRDQEGLFGSYRSALRARPDLYSSVDTLLMRAIMGEELSETLTETQKKEWAIHINSFASHYHEKATDGSYFDTMGHSSLHGNGQVIGALGLIGGKQRFPVKLYEAFDTIEKIGPWLEKFDWPGQWPSSHLFWGGLHCFSFSKKCPSGWVETVITWLNQNLDSKTGWWRQGTMYTDRHQPLGGAVHIYPIYQHHGYSFPMPERVIDSVLEMQIPAGNWLDRNKVGIMHYLELDALYALAQMRDQVPTYKKEKLESAVRKYGKLVKQYWQNEQASLWSMHPHLILAAVGTFGLLQRLLPDEWVDDKKWTDIFSDRRFYRTSEVEVFL
jgi:hypothetical protein